MRTLTIFLLALPLAAQHDMSTMQEMANMPNMDHGKMGQPHWSFMVHGRAFIGTIQQTGPRGHDKFAAMNWIMGEASHAAAGGMFTARSMLSLDPATVTGRYYPEFFQTGETAYGKPLIDGQHPHNFVMDLSLHYSHPITAGFSWEIAVAAVGDPALGPTAFAHRASGAELPQATLGHHLQDSTHISDDVITAGIRSGVWHLEASGFNGTEPDEQRWKIGHGALNSYSARLTVAPAPHWSAQFSAGRLKHPEVLEDGDQTRLSASISHFRPFSNGDWNTSVIWGRVHKTESQANLNGFVLESVARFAEVNYVTGRVERLDKDELSLPGSYRVNAFTFGYTRDFKLVSFLKTGIGVNLTTYPLPAPLHRIYGDQPLAAIIFLRVRGSGGA